MEVANELVKQVVPILMIPINKYLRYLISCTKYVRDMGIKMTELNAARIGVEEHMMRNTSSHLEVPAQVTGWLEDAEKINAKVKHVPTSNFGGCFNLKIRHKAGRNAFNIIEEIDSVMRRHSLITWTDHPIPLGRVDSMKASTSTPSTDHHNGFQSREETFTKALNALGPKQKSHMVALCGMGGIGKTTLMKKLKDVVEKKKMFNYIVMVVIGEKTDPIAIQKAVADYLCIELRESTKPARADKLRKWFEDNSNKGENKFLVILDDVWQFVDLEDIGLGTSLQNQVVNFKVLLTSRRRDVCTMMGVEANSILNVKVLIEAEAHSLFLQFVEIVDPQLQKIGEDIVRKCCGLPIAIKTMALTLRNKSKHAWKDALSRLEDHDIENVVNEVFKMSYRNLQDEETESIFFLCGLFPEDFDIPTEELLRYGWGLNLFKKVYTIRRARTRLHSCIERLMHSNLLIESDEVGCIKMHDLVRAFVLAMYSKVEHASIVNHGSISGWPNNDMSGSCKAISLTCEGMSQFPRDLRFPNLTILKLMQGDKSLRFPQDFYGEMEKLQVLSYDNMKYPLTPSSPQCSINLRVLHLHECSLKFDCSSIGNLLNLEVLSFAKSSLGWLPSTIGNLKKLRLLDLSDCERLRIENGALKNLVKLEELYMGVNGQYGKSISLTDENCSEMVERSENLCALEFEFFKNDAQPNNMSFEKLQRFKISVGRYFKRDFSKSADSFENTLQLVTNKGEVLESRMNELFEKTEVLCLSLGDMNDLEDVEVKSSHSPKSSSFYNLRVLVISECAELRYLFTLGAAKALSKLEHLEVEKCLIMEELIHTESNGEETIKFPKLKVLSLLWLPKLTGLCHNVDIIELPQLMELKVSGIPGFTSIYPENKLETSSLLKDQVVIPKLEKLHIHDMENLKEIWPYESSMSENIRLREMKVSKCDNLVNLFPSNPIPLLHHLEELEVRECGSIKVLFNIDLDCIGENGESNSGLSIIKVFQCDSLVNLFPCNPMPFMHNLEELTIMFCDSIEVLFNIDLECVGETREGGINSSLRSIMLRQLGKLREVWRIKGADNSRLLVSGFQAVESISISRCERLRNVFAPITTNFDLGALMKISIDNSGGNRNGDELPESSQEEKQISILSKKETSKVCSTSDSHSVFSSSLMHSFHNLREFELSNYGGVEVVFDIESPTSRELVTSLDHQQRLFPYLAKFKISGGAMRHVWKCNWSKFLILQNHLSLESPFHNLTTICIAYCNRIKYLFSPLMAKLLSNLKEVDIKGCIRIEELVSNKYDEDEEETTSISPHTDTNLFPRLESLTLGSLLYLKYIGGGGAQLRNNELSFNDTTTTTTFFDKSKLSQAIGVCSWTLCQYSRKISIKKCHSLSSVIPSYAAGQMQKLQVLKIEDCKWMKEVFETQGMNNKSGFSEGIVGMPGISRLNNVIMLPNLKILNIERCECLEHIFTFSALESLRQLEELTIKICEKMKVIVKDEDDGEQTRRSSSKVVEFPRLKSIILVDLRNLVGFFLGKNEFRFPSLENVVIKQCPQMMVFAPGGSTAQKLKHIHANLGKHSLEECGLNFYVTTATHYQTPFSSLAGTSSCPDTLKEIWWSFHNLIELDTSITFFGGMIIPSDMLLQLQKLEKIHLKGGDVVEVFEALEGTNSSGFDESQTVVKLPNLREIELEWLSDLKYIWKSNRWTRFEFSNLTRLSIENCRRLKQVFTSSMVGSILQLQELYISNCSDLKEVIGKDENVVVQAEEDGQMNAFVLPCLKSLTLDRLQHLKGFCLGKEDFAFPLLDTLRIESCPEITIFTKGNSTTPQLKEIETNFGWSYVGEDINSFIKTKQNEFEAY